MNTTPKSIDIGYGQLLGMLSKGTEDVKATTREAKICQASLTLLFIRPLEVGISIF
jgi:hypothetical protein